MAARRRTEDDSHAPFAESGVKLAFGRGWDGRIVHISEADRGLSCGCSCPAIGCGARLVARKGQKSVHHFGHARRGGPDDGKPPCDGGHMTALHEFAQRLVAERLELRLPATYVDVDGDTRIGGPARTVSFDAAALERRVGGFVVDVLMEKGRRRLNVEILVTHACPEAKVEAMRAAGEALVEIDLSAVPRDLPLEHLRETILYGSPRRWLHNDVVERLKADADEERRRMAEESERERRAVTAAAVERYGRLASRIRQLPPDDPTTRRLGRARWAAAVVSYPEPGSGYFKVPSSVWGLHVLVHVLPDGRWSKPSHALASLRASDMLNEGMADEAEANPELRSALARELGDRHRAPLAVVLDFLAHLAREGAAREHDGLWTRGADVTRMIVAEAEEARLAAVARQEAARRTEALLSVLSSISEALPEAERDGLRARAAAWLDTPLDGLSPQKTAEAGGDRWDGLYAGLRKLRRVLAGASDIRPPTLGLGLSVATERALAARRLRLAEQEAEEREARRLEEERLLREATDRRRNLERRAADLLGDEASAWLGTPGTRSGMLPADLAASSDDGLERAMSVLRRASDARWERQKWKDKLAAVIDRIHRTPELRELAKRAADPRLPGRVSMLAFCRDEATFDMCKGLLMHGPRGRR